MQTAVDQAQEHAEPWLPGALFLEEPEARIELNSNLKLKLKAHKNCLAVSPASSCSNFSDGVARSRAGSGYIQCLSIAAGLVIFSSSGF